MLRRQRAAVFERDAKLAAYVTDRLAEGWAPEQIAGRLRLGIETGLPAACTETLYGWIYRAGQKTERLWRFLTRRRARRRCPARTQVTVRTGHTGYTFRLFEAGGVDAVERKYAHGRTSSLRRPAP